MGARAARAFRWLFREPGGAEIILTIALVTFVAIALASKAFK